MTHPSMQQRTQWILKGFGRYGLKITQSALDSFLEKQVMTWKTSEMRWKNWLLFVWEKKASQKKNVDFVCTEQIENRIFDMTQAVAEGKTQYALELYADLLALKEPGMRILFLIARQMNQLFMCKGDGSRTSELRIKIAAALKVRSFVV